MIRDQKSHDRMMQSGWNGLAAAFPVGVAPCQVPVCDLSAVRARDDAARIAAAQAKRARRAARAAK